MNKKIHELGAAAAVPSGVKPCAPDSDRRSCSPRLGGDTGWLKPRPLSGLLAAVGLLTLPAFAQIAASTLPSGGVVAAGNAAISQAGAAMRVDQASAKAVIDWQSFNIGRDASVRFYQPSASSIALNRVGADGGRSIIDGRLTANGQVWLLNPGGVLFGPTARVDVGGLLAGSLKLGNDDFMNGNYRFGKDGSGSIVNQGTLTAADGGYVALLAPEVRNEGVVAARLGTIALASGDEMRVDFSGDRLIEIKVDQAAVNGLIDNRNLVEAEGGWVLMSAGAAGDLASGAINSIGVVRASSLTAHEGFIRLEGGFVALGGTVSTDGERGGAISVSASRDLSLADSVTARGTAGVGGSVSYSVGGRLVETTTSHTDVSGQTDGGTIRAVADGGILSSGTYSAIGTSGQGGRIDLSGGSVRLLSATLNASGATLGGLVRVGGAFQGGKAQDTTSDTWQRYIGRFGTLSDLSNAQRTFINDSSSINVSSRVDAGGTAIIWSDAQTTFLGRIAAKGGAVEVSSAGDLRYVNLIGLDLGTGFLLLDPKNIVIGDFPAAGTWAYQAILGKGYSSAGRNVDVSSLDANDYFGVSVALNAVSDRMAVAAQLDAGSTNSTTNSGAVRLFSFTDNKFSSGSLQAIIGKGYSGGKNVDVASLESGDQFGFSVALNGSGDVLAVGATGDAGSGNIAASSGAVRLFSFTDTSFTGGTLQATIGKGYTGGKNVDVANLEASDLFGTGVALNGTGDRLAVGASFDAGNGNIASQSGAVRLFSFTDTNFSGGTLQATIGKGYTVGKDMNVTSLEAGDYFGRSVALNAIGDRLAVGAMGDAGSGNAASESGAVHLFSFTDSNFSGGTLQGTVGRGYTGGKNVDVATLESNDWFGGAIALNAAGDRLAVGAPRDAGSGNNLSQSGAVRLFGFTDTNFSGGALQATLGKGYTGGKNVDVSNLEADDQFGISVALNASGDRLGVGAIYDDGFGNSLTGSGAVYLFSFTDTNFSNGSLQAIMGKGYKANRNVNVGGLDATDLFGGSLSLNAAGDRLAVGSFGDDGAGNSLSDSGAVRLYSFTDTNFSGGVLHATLGKGYSGGKNIDVSSLTASNSFGDSVALNATGDRLAVGSVGDKGFGGGATAYGAVRLFSFSDTTFTGGTLQSTIGKGYTGGKNLDISSLEANDAFGMALSLNAAGDRLAVGASLDGGFGNVAPASGSVHLFNFTDTSFSGGSLQGTLGKGYVGGKNVDVSGLEAGDHFGGAVSLNGTGNRLVVGAWSDGGAGNVAGSSGAVHLFSFTDSSFTGGVLQGTIGKGYTGGKNFDLTGLEANDFFGRSAALNAAGDRLAVGAHSDDGFGNAMTDSGVVYLFGFSDGNFGGATLQGTMGKGYTGGKNVDVTNLEANDRFGSTVAINATGDRLAVGAYGDAGSGNNVSNSGAVHLFNFNDTNFSGGSLLGTMGAGYTGGRNVDVSSLEATDQFGSNAVALNAAGDRLAIGAYQDDGAGNSVTDSGAVRLFSFTDTHFSGAALQATLGKGYSGGKNFDVSSLEAVDSFGNAVSLNAAGDRLAVGAYRDDGSGNSVSDSGAVHLFSFTDTNFSGGTLQATVGKGYTGGKNVDVSSLEAVDYFGYSVSLNSAGDRLAVGAILDDGNSNSTPNSGAVRLFSFADTNFSGGALQATLGKGYSGGKNLDIATLEANDFFGGAVSLNGIGDRLAVGAYGDAGSGNVASQSGAVRLFSFADANFSGGVLEATMGKGYIGGKNLDVSSLQATDYFGTSVSLNAAGDRLAVGIYLDDGNANSMTDSGAVHLYSFSDTNFSGGTLHSMIGKGYAGGKNVDVASLEANDGFGASVALNGAGNRLAVGAAGDDGSGNSVSGSGAVYLFAATPEGSSPVSSVAFASNPGATQNVDRTSLQTLLSAGTSVTLQASNDITWHSGSNLAVNNPSGNGGALTLQAGRSILLNSSISTDNGNLSLWANELASSGVVNADRDPGAANITIAGSTAIDAGTGTVTMTIRDGVGLTNTTAGTLNVVGNVMANGVQYIANDMALSGTTTANISTSLSPYAPTGPTRIESTPTAGGLSLTPAEIATLHAPQVYVGNAPGVSIPLVVAASLSDSDLNTAILVLGGTSVSIDAPISLTSGATALQFSTGNGGVMLNAPVSVNSKVTFLLNSGGGVTQTATAPLTANLMIGAGDGFVDLDTATGGNRISSVHGNLMAGTFWVINDSTAMTVLSPSGTGYGITAGNIGLYTRGNLALNAPLVANGTNPVPVGTVSTIDPLCSGPCVRPHIELGSGGSFANNVGASGVSVLTGKYWSLRANMPSTTTLNGLVPAAVSFDADSIRGDILLSANRVFYAAHDPAPSSPVSTATTSTATTVSQQSSSGTSLTVTPPVAAATQPAGGTGSGGATMSNFTAISPPAPAPATVETTTPATTQAATETAPAPTVLARAEPEPPPPPPKLIVDASKSVPRAAGVLNRADLQAMSRQVHEARTQLFADALSQLAKDPKAADVADCGTSGGDICIAAARPLTASVQDSYLPVVKRKVALLIGNNSYRSPIGDLETAINDVTAIGAQLRDTMGYEVKVMQNADRKGIVDALNELIRNTERDDSVMVMYAGHGYLEEGNNRGYWLPSDADATKPDNWISNDTIARALGNIPAKQVMLVSDSCYSGTLTKEGKVTETVGVAREQTLTRRSVMALSSGGDEPVSDEGRDNHSIFAWNMIQSLKQMKDETPGQKFHAAIKEAVTKDFPQVPQYGTVVSAGHAAGGEYLLTPKR